MKGWWATDLLVFLFLILDSRKVETELTDTENFGFMYFQIKGQL